MFKPASFATTLTIVILVAIGPLATDMYLPAFPVLMREFEAGAGAVQRTLSVFLFGFAIAQLVYGPLSDRFGRKPVLLGGMLLFMLSSLGAAAAESIELLTLMRLFQAMGGSAGPVLGRAMVRDIHGPRESARLLSYIAAAMAVAPAAAPLAGGYLTVWFGWEAIFLCLFLYGLLGIVILAWKIPETAPAGSHRMLNPAAILRDFGTLLRDRRWCSYTLCLSAAYAGLFAFLSGSAFVIIDFFGYPEQRFGLFFALVVCGYIGGTLTAGKLAGRLPTNTLVGYGSVIAAISGGAMAMLALARVDSVWAIVLPEAVFMLGAGIIMPQALAGGLAPYPHMAGTSSSLIGFIQMLLAAIAGILVGQFHDGTPLVMSLAVGIAGAAALISYATFPREPP